MAFIGVGGRCQPSSHIKHREASQGAGRRRRVGVCDVWDGLEREYEVKGSDGKVSKRTYLQGLLPVGKKCGLSADDKQHVVKDYRRLLELKEVGRRLHRDA